MKLVHCYDEHRRMYQNCEFHGIWANKWESIGEWGSNGELLKVIKCYAVYICINHKIQRTRYKFMCYVGNQLHSYFRPVQTLHYNLWNKLKHVCQLYSYIHYFSYTRYSKWTCNTKTKPKWADDIPGHCIYIHVKGQDRLRHLISPWFVMSPGVAQ